MDFPPHPTPGRRARITAATAPALPPAPEPGAGDRVLVFAPHPDDEVLALGGLLFQAARRGADVRVVYLTDGDAFTLCAAAHYHCWPNAAAMQRLAQQRRNEARAALPRLGLAPDRALFLGFPDRGLAPLWLEHWNSKNPFCSPYTRQTHTPEPALFPGAAYGGEALLHAVTTLLHRFRPDFLYYPDPADDHPDHWAAHCFVRLALERCSSAPAAKTYLIHRGRWPVPLRNDAGLYLHAPEDLSRLDLAWEAVPLVPEALQAKQQALQAYASQGALVGNFLAAFLRRNELLAERPAVALEVPAPDSQRDRWGRARWPAVDFTAVSVSFQSGGVLVRAGLRAAAARWPQYRLDWKPAEGLAAGLATRSHTLSGTRRGTGEPALTAAGAELRLALPPRMLEGVSSILLSASAWSGPLLLDRTPWRVFRLAESPAVEPFRRETIPALSFRRQEESHPHAFGPDPSLPSE